MFQEKLNIPPIWSYEWERRQIFPWKELFSLEVYPVPLNHIIYTSALARVFAVCKSVCFSLLKINATQNCSRQYSKFLLFSFLQENKDLASHMNCLLGRQFTRNVNPYFLLTTQLKIPKCPLLQLWLAVNLKAPRKSASENVVCLCRLLHLLANFSNLHFAYRQTVCTQIRLLLKEQSDLGQHCLQKWLLK